MDWTEEDRKALIEFTKSIDSDDIKVKEVLKQHLLNNRFIIHSIANTELEEAEAEPDEYFGVNILPYYIVPSTQTHNQTFICYEVSYRDLDGSNRAFKLLNVTFYILCDHTNSDWCIDQDTGIARHDLIASLIQDQFNFTNYVGGGKLRLVQDIPGTTDDYSTRTLIFEQETDNNLVKTRQGVPMFSNKMSIKSQFED